MPEAVLGATHPQRFAPLALAPNRCRARIALPCTMKCSGFQLHLIVSIHAPYGLLDFATAPGTPPPKLGRLYLTRGHLPGSLGNYGGIHKGHAGRHHRTAQRLPHPAGSRDAPDVADLLRWMSAHIPATRPDLAAATAVPPAPARRRPGPEPGMISQTGVVTENLMSKLPFAL